MNSLFSELFKKFGGVFLEVCETISGVSGEVFRGNIKDNYPEQIRKHNKILLDTIQFYLNWL